MADSKKYDGSQWEHSLRKLTTATEAVENPLYSDGTAITAYTIKGNTIQNGTPTPINPVEVNGVGVRTENLLTQNYVSKGLNWLDGTISNTIMPNRLTTMDFSDITSGQVTAAVYDANSNSYDGVLLEYDSSGNYTGNYQKWHTLPYTWTVASNAKVRISVKRSDNYDIDADNTKIMLNTGSTAKPYEPYGYKIPILSGGVTTNIYLGSTQSTRQIKKLVLDGTEDWRTSNTYPGGFFCNNLLQPSATMSAICSHFENATSAGDYSAGTFLLGGTNYVNVNMRQSNTSWKANDFKAWLAQEYANGTPVTVWYVLATPETAAVNEPLMKIGDYADTVSNATAIPTTDGANTIAVDTTVQPSEFTATWTGWHNASVQEWGGSQWNE